MPPEHFDVLIVGAGISGIGAACHLQSNCPRKTYAILEARERSGGTWDLFRYPGVRSDSDMYTLGFAFRPWRDAKAIAGGPAILDYLNRTAREHGVDKHIRCTHRAKRAEWSTPDARWTVEVERGASREPVRYTCNFLFMCSGYYDYAQGYTPEFPGVSRFAGRIVHPQKWTDDIDYGGKRVIVIGSGATAVTLVPALAESAAHVVMLQRSPSYVVSSPASDAIANWLRRCLPAKLAHGMTRWKNVLRGMLLFNLSRRHPERVKKIIRAGVRRALGPDYDIDKHFTPRYNPWDQRMCLIPDGDLFAALKAGRASVVTDRIETFTETGIELQSGQELQADLIVTATGPIVQMFGGMQVSVDGRSVDMATRLAYKGMMYNDIPNLAAAFGYTNASWTLKVDLTCDYLCRLLNYMDANGLSYCTPRNHDPSLGTRPWVDFSSGYIRRARNVMPKQGARRPWRLHQNYALDLFALKFGAVDDGVMEFSGR